LYESTSLTEEVAVATQSQESTPTPQVVTLEELEVEIIERMTEDGITASDVTKP
jgi:hypothetical protein